MSISTSDKLDLNAFKDWVENFQSKLGHRDLVLLSGSMGAGKTQFVKFLLQALGGEAPSSPSYAIHQSYEIKNSTVDHIDLYRLEDDDDLESTGFWDLFEKTEGLIVVEWADRISSEVYPLYWKQHHIQLVRDDRGVVVTVGL
ncbi:MAG: tRNA (adenosine(37)-N6)-threonylcarbamoyltransferase complex ATPase subunit type 1 TsaE [Bdellovibrionaceae bacterium]|jgi:tRNA threonylcarbamoyladenosine biosynthesis protein TsaE|nr:tRNA (adenosine(37)-N6)-threonylcarbamoyltransferase complex ATPase subunit type 1 TsaE [Pseudobdellovibrionaceae bacterium]